MATPKTSLPASNPRKIFKTHTHSLKQTEKHLLLSTTYGLNHSFTKKINVGLGLRGDSEYELLIRLVNNSCGGICLKLDSWIALIDATDIISDYFAFDIYADAQWYFETLDLGECKLTFTTAHGARAIRFDVPAADADISSNAIDDDARDGDHEDDQPSAKRQKLYQPSIVMQKTTFDGLKSLVPCVQERIRMLKKLKDDVNTCKKLFAEFITEKVKTLLPTQPSLQSISQIAQREYDAAVEHIKPLIDLEFRENYLDIVLLEISKLFPYYVAAQVKQLIEAQPK